MNRTAIELPDCSSFDAEIDAGNSERFEILMARQLDFHHLEFFPTWIQDELSKVGPYSSEVREFLIRNSLICHEVGTGNPASDRICRVVYSDSYLGWGPIDDWISRCLGGKSLFNRLPRVSEILTNRLALVSSPRYIIKDLGAGSGSYAFKSLGQLRTMGKKINQINWQCIDLSEDAINFGIGRAVKDGLSDSVNFRLENFLSSKFYPADHDLADLLILIGVLCGMTKQKSADCLEKIKPHGKPASEIIAATLLVQSYKEDPWVYQLLAKLGWYLRPKTLAEVEGVFQQAGYKISAINSERFDSQGNEIPGEYAIVTATLP